MPKSKILLAVAGLCLTACDNTVDTAQVNTPPTPVATHESLDPYWRNLSVYFIMTDRFNNGDPSNDMSVGRKRDAGLLRGFEGGDIRGIIQKIDEGYFDALGIDAIWTTPLIEQVHGFVSEGGENKTYAYHGYWPKDWTAVDPNYGTEADMREMIEKAHRRGIRIIADVIINHTGPKTDVDPLWPEEWVKRGPECDWSDYANNVSCLLAQSLPDIQTATDTPVDLPPPLVEKWKNEGRFDSEMRELDAFFERTSLPRAPKYYLIKWLTDWVREYGIDGFRVDTAKHIEAETWGVLKVEATKALREWKAANPNLKIDDKDFYMVGEVFNYGLDGFKAAVQGGRAYDYSDRQVDFFEHGFDALINMGFATHAAKPYEELFSLYSKELTHSPYKGVGTLNYISSHDDQEPFDGSRSKAFESANKLMLAPGGVQIYYGDETARSLIVEGTYGDATLRSAMNWEQLKEEDIQDLLRHWQKLGQFRKAHPALGAGVHKKLGDTPYIFSRTLDEAGIQDRVIVALAESGASLNHLPVYGTFADGTVLKDYYSGQIATVKDGGVSLNTSHSVALLGEYRPINE